MRLNRANASYQALGRLKPGEMNRTEQAYAKHLEEQKIVGAVLWWALHPIKLRLADGCFYSPDFGVLQADGLLALHEVKGKTRKTSTNGEKYDAAFSQDTSKVKIRVAAEQFPIKFVLAFPATGGGWHQEEIA